MLNKGVCKKCWDSYSNFDISFGLITDNEIMCPQKISKKTFLDKDRYAKRSDPPPEWCPHKFEHAVAAGMTK